MLTREQNELLCRVGPGTPMGNLMRRFWVPALLSEELPGPDCPPVRVRLLGENLVAFRTTGGQVGLVGDNCPHRGASLFFGRNEEEGLRCVYHGWKFDVAGNCMDMPNEPAVGAQHAAPLRPKIHHTAYPCREVNGIVWAYMGPLPLGRSFPELVEGNDLPALPAFLWNAVPESHVLTTKILQESSYLQGVEGGIDSSHVTFLHRKLGAANLSGWSGGPASVYTMTDGQARAEAVETVYGSMVASRRNAPDGYYWRISHFLLPWYTIFPGLLGPSGTVGAHAWVPLDDERCWRWSITWHPERPYTAEEREELLRNGWVHGETIPGTYLPLRNRATDYLIDREMQRTANFTGIEGFAEQDAAVQESMGAIYDRTKEHLGVADAGIIHLRRILLRQVADLQAGREPAAPRAPESYAVRSDAFVLPPDASWVEFARERGQASRVHR